MMKKALVLQGGGLRGAFTAGVLDVFIQNGIEFDYIIGTSAGALNGTNYITKQVGRSFGIIYGFCHDHRFGSFSNLIKNHNYFDSNYLFKDISEKILPFDFKTFNESKTVFYCVATCLQNGGATYFSKERSDFWKCLGASMSLPLISTPVEIDGNEYLDGGNSEPIPFRKPMDEGYQKIVIIETREKSYRKENRRLANRIYNRLYDNYPEYLNCLREYSNIYNNRVETIEFLEKSGKVFVIRPDKPVSVSRTEKNKEKIKNLYDDGVRVAKELLDPLRKYIGE